VVVQVIAFAIKQKEQANRLYKAERLDFAIRKYDRVVSVLKKFRDVQTNDEAAALTELHTTLLSNLAAAYIAKRVLTCLLL
jgi:hypothetical protein